MGGSERAIEILTVFLLVSINPCMNALATVKSLNLGAHS